MRQRQVDLMMSARRGADAAVCGLELYLEALAAARRRERTQDSPPDHEF